MLACHARFFTGIKSDPRLGFETLVSFWNGVKLVPRLNCLIQLGFSSSFIF